MRTKLKMPELIKQFICVQECERAHTHTLSPQADKQKSGISETRSVEGVMINSLSFFQKL